MDKPSAYTWKDIPHLAQRTLWSLRRPTPDAADEAWLLSLLSPAETELYRAMSVVDQAHAVVCAREVDHLGAEVAVASAMHDVGKNDAKLGTPGRIVASLVGLTIEDTARGWKTKSGFLGKIGRYLNHSEAGAEVLRDAGSSALSIAWAREHHLPAEEQTIDPALAAVLKDADE